LEKKNVPIGAMRNRAVKKAQHDIILFMDDDDHYPPSSFTRRVAWLLNHPWAPSAVACTTLACYHLVRGTSAVNTPPWSLPLRQRISEATLTFKKSWWEGHRFPKVSMAEGEGFLEGRESEVLELQPQQIIVAMSHGKNASSRRIPPVGPPSCFWGFPKEFLVFLHRLAGVDVEETSSGA
jgi:glycosyltransferase involved in cell wall biosynthesis